MWGVVSVAGVVYGAVSTFPISTQARIAGLCLWVLLALVVLFVANDAVSRAIDWIEAVELRRHPMRNALLVATVFLVSGSLLAESAVVEARHPTWPTGANGVYPLQHGSVHVADYGPWQSSDSGLVMQAGVANVSAGDNSYSPSVPATFDEVVKVEVSYYEYKAVPFEDILPRCTLPSKPGVRQSISCSLTASPGVSLSSTVIVDDQHPYEKLAYVPGSLMWKHQSYPGGEGKPFQTNPLPDADLLDPSHPLESIAPGGGGSISFLERVVEYGISIITNERSPYGTEWLQSVSAVDGDEVEIELVITNSGNLPLDQLVVGDYLPPKAEYVRNTTELVDDSNPSGIGYQDGIVDRRDPYGSRSPRVQRPIAVGSLPVGASLTIRFVARIRGAAKEATMKDVGYVRASGVDEYYNTAITKIAS